jgi:hypothetical protein
MIQHQRPQICTTDLKTRHEKKSLEKKGDLQEQEEEQGEKRRRICGDESAEELLLPIHT